MGKFIKGMMAGMMVGVAAEMMMMPHYSKRTMRRMRRTGKRMRNMMENTYEGFHNMID